MSFIWAPWRMKYIEEKTNKEKCPFCAVLTETEDRENFIILRGKTSFVMLNRYPYTSGHLLILPVKHKERLGDIDKKARTEMAELVNRAVEVLEIAYHPGGFNIGLNIGEAAGAGIPKHLHWHIVPRWAGDTNYMTSIGSTRVLPESLEDTYLRIKSIW